MFICASSHLGEFTKFDEMPTLVPRGKLAAAAVEAASLSDEQHDARCCSGKVDAGPYLALTLMSWVLCPVPCGLFAAAMCQQSQAHNACFLSDEYRTKKTRRQGGSSYEFTCCATTCVHRSRVRDHCVASSCSARCDNSLHNMNKIRQSRVQVCLYLSNSWCVL